MLLSHFLLFDVLARRPMVRFCRIHLLRLYNLGPPFLELRQSFTSDGNSFNFSSSLPTVCQVVRICYRSECAHLPMEKERRHFLHEVHTDTFVFILFPRILKYDPTRFFKSVIEFSLRALIIFDHQVIFKIIVFSNL